jgi:YibE/F-like protein
VLGSNIDLMAHNHPHGWNFDGAGVTTQDLVASRSVTTLIRSAVGLGAVVTMVGLVVFWPRGATGQSSDSTLFSDPPIKARVTDVTAAPCTGTTEADNAPCNFIRLQLDGQTAPESEVPRGGGQPAPQAQPTIEQAVSGVGSLHPGDDIYVNMTVLPDGSASFSFYDYQRATPMWVLAIAFVAAVLVLGRWRGLGAIAGLAASLWVIVKFLLPSILDGHSPVMVAIVASSLIAFVALYLAHGVTIPTSVALLGTFASLAVTAVLSLLFVAWACNWDSRHTAPTSSLRSMASTSIKRGSEECRSTSTTSFSTPSVATPDSQQARCRPPAGVR